MMAKDQQEGTPGRDGTAASQVQTADAVLAEQDLVRAYSSTTVQLPGLIRWL